MPEDLSNLIILSLEQQLIDLGVTGGSDKNATFDLVTVTSVELVHNLGKRVSVMATDDAGNECDVDWEYVTGFENDKIKIDFAPAFTGKIICN